MLKGSNFATPKREETLKRKRRRPWRGEEVIVIKKTERKKTKSVACKDSLKKKDCFNENLQRGKMK